MSPPLFELLNNKIIKNTRLKTTKRQTIIRYNKLELIKVDNLPYADDTVLIADTHKKMEDLIQIWVRKIEQMKLEININECKFMLATNPQTANNNFKLKFKEIEKVAMLR